MVISFNLIDTLKNDASTNNLNLPAVKNNGLKISYENITSDNPVYQSKMILPFSASEVCLASLIDSRRLSADSTQCKAIYEISFDISERSFEFNAGDTVGIIPQNNCVEVESILRHLDLLNVADYCYSLEVDENVKGCKVPPHVPVKSSLRHVLTNALELRGILKKLFILSLSRHTSDETEKRVLEFLSSKEGSQAYNMHILDNKMSILDIFHIFKSCKPPVELLISNLPRLLPRPYSIANSSEKNKNLIKICFSVIENDSNKGITTGWLERLINADSNIVDKMNNLNIICKKPEIIPLYLRKNINSFLLPKDPATPIILICQSTGLSPFIGFLEEIEAMKNNNLNMGDVWLFFGCRYPKLDYIYQEELESFLKKNVLQKLCTSFSRIGNEENKYVQDNILQHDEEIVKLLNRGAAIYVCGDHKTMAVQVKENIIKCLIRCTGKSENEAKEFISEMENDKRYLIDLWS